ncbi:MAG: DUF6517 family protein [Halobacteriaceae archaeon]
MAPARLGRATLLLALVLGPGLAAGCLGSDGGPVRAAGTPAGLADGTGYDRVAATNRTLNATVTRTVMGDVEGRTSLDVVATVPVRTYRDGEAVLAVASSPYVTVVENPPQGGDPLSTLSTAATVAFVQDRYADVRDVRRVSEDDVAMLGTETTLVTARARATRAGADRAVRIRVARVRHEGDVVTVVAVAAPEGGPAPATPLQRVRHPATAAD